jgi:hypothetical protein
VKGEEDPSENVEETSNEQPNEGTPLTPLTGVGSVTGPVDQRAALELALQLLAISSGTGEAMARAEATPPEGSISTAPSVRAARRGRLSRILAVVAVALVIVTVGGAVVRSRLSSSRPVTRQDEEPRKLPTQTQDEANLTTTKGHPGDAPKSPATGATTPATSRSKAAAAGAAHRGSSTTLSKDQSDSPSNEAHLTHTVPRF